MATRTIVTSQPDVACDVCERRLLRGEQPDVFVAAGRRRIVCELCAPRAAHEGWLRESESQSLSLPPMRPRRGRSLFERLQGSFKMRPADTLEPASAPSGDARVEPTGRSAAERPAEPYDLFAESSPPEPPPAESAPPTGHGRALSEPAPLEALSESASETAAVAAEPASASAQPGSVADALASASEEHSPYVEQAIAVFNGSEFPRRLAGVARSLGAPSVNVRSAEHLESVVSIVVAWELCWYRYEVDLSEPVVEATMIAQGTELSELAREDRQANAAVGESGTLAIAGA